MSAESKNNSVQVGELISKFDFTIPLEVFSNALVKTDSINSLAKSLRWPKVADATVSGAILSLLHSISELGFLGEFDKISKRPVQFGY